MTSSTTLSSLPTLWLLGKTGAGKSSIIQAMTGDSAVVIGNGFAPCTQTAMRYPYPIDQPLMQFLDTRGLGEVNYDPSDDIDFASQASCGLVVVMKVDDPDQHELLSVLKKIKADHRIRSLLLVQTAALSVSETDRHRLQSLQYEQVEAIWKTPFLSALIDFDTNHPHYSETYSPAVLIECLKTYVPPLAEMMAHRANQQHEKAQFDALKSKIRRYASMAAASDLLPAVGLVTVPALQSKMLHSLATHYELSWNKSLAAELISCLGGSFALQYGVKLGIRQLIKWIPVYGQTMGAVSAASISFGTTYGLGRAACYYFYQKSHQQHIDPEQLKSLYDTALNRAQKVYQHET